MSSSHDSESASDAAERKRVDEAWKESIAKEKASRPEGVEPEAALDQTSFLFFITSLGMQAFYMMGELPNEKGERPEADLKQARYLIDILQMLSEKTQNNLTPEEAEALKGLLYELQMKFVQKSQAV